MNYCVTGGAGFIGSHMCEKLLEKGNFVLCIDNLSTGTIDNIKHLLDNKNFEFLNCDIMKKNIIKKAIDENSIDVVFHYAAVVGVKRTLENPLNVLDVNIKGTKNMLEASLGVKKFIFISSSEVYGEPLTIPEKEGDPPSPKLPYSISKLVGEKYCEAYYREFGLKTTSLRLFNVYGPRQNSTPYGFVVSIFINQVLDNKPPTVYGRGKQTRDFTFIEDNINPTLLAAEKNSAINEVINIGTGKSVTILDLANLIIKLAGKKLKPVFTKQGKGDIIHRCPNITKMKKILGYAPKYTLEEGLKLTIDATIAGR